MQRWDQAVNGTGLLDMLQQSFGWALTAGYQAKQAAAPFRFPVIVGELGASLNSSQVNHQ